MIRDNQIAIGICALTILYLFSSVLPVLGIFSQVYFVLLMGANFYYLVKCNFLKLPHSGFIKILTVFYFLNLIGYILTADHSNSNSFGMAKGVLLVISSFYPFYYFGFKQIDLRKTLRIMFYVAIPLTVLLYFKTEREILLEKMSDSVNVVNNISYLFLFLSPFVFLIKNKIIKNLIFLIMFTFIIESAKRGALLIFVVIFVYNIYLQLKETAKEKPIKQLTNGLIYFVAIVGSFIYLQSRLLENEFLIKRLQGIEEGQLSGRDVIFESLIDNWVNSEYFIQLFIGYGFASTLNLSATGNFAHNDWLELLTNFGLIGVILYAILLYQIGKIGFLKKNPIILSSILIILSSTMFSMFYTSLNSVFIMQLIGYFFIFKETNANKNP